MRRKLVASSIAVLALVIAIPAFAGGAYCSGGAAAGSRSASMAWAGAWLQRSATGVVTVADVAKASPAERAGLRTGDVVTAVNGHDISECSAHASMCSDKSACSVGSTVTYNVQRGRASKAIRVKLESMPNEATRRYAHRDASFDPALAAMVMTAAR